MGPVPDELGVNDPRPRLRKTTKEAMNVVDVHLHFRIRHVLPPEPVHDGMGQGDMVANPVGDALAQGGIPSVDEVQDGDAVATEVLQQF